MSEVTPESVETQSPDPDEQLEGYMMGTPLPDTMPDDLKRLWEDRMNFVDEQRGHYGYKHQA